MSGFKCKELNDIAKINTFDKIMEFIFSSLEKMKQDLTLQGKKIENNEEKIRNHLIENYLTELDFKKAQCFNDYLLFESEVPVGYDKEKDIYVGRADIKVFNVSKILSNKEDYYVIECKKLDGLKELNKKYVLEGICRFVLDPPKYSSFNNKNAMLGFVIKNIDINVNASKIMIYKSKMKIYIL